MSKTRKPKPKPLALVCYSKTHRRFKVGVYPVTDKTTRYAIWDNQKDEFGCGTWLFSKESKPGPYRGIAIYPGRSWPTRAAAQRYLETTTVENRAYRLYMLNRCLDRDEA